MRYTCYRIKLNLDIAHVTHSDDGSNLDLSEWLLRVQGQLVGRPAPCDVPCQLFPVQTAGKLLVTTNPCLMSVGPTPSDRPPSVP
jgi:hypothetical protein